jgi:hypothetical protein
VVCDWRTTKGPGHLKIVELWIGKGTTHRLRSMIRVPWHKKGSFLNRNLEEQGRKDTCPQGSDVSVHCAGRLKEGGGWGEGAVRRWVEKNPPKRGCRPSRADVRVRTGE